MSSSSLHYLVADFLRKRAGQRLTAEEIAQGIISDHPRRFEEKKERLQGRRPLVDQVSREIYAQKNTLLSNNPDIAVDTSRRPLRLFVDSQGDAVATVPLGQEDVEKLLDEIEIEVDPPITIAAIAKAPSQDRLEDQGEHDLYAPLQRFLFGELSIVSKRIRESASSNRRGKNGNKWLHPDIVGMLAPGQHWNSIVRECSMELPTRKAKLISVEVKVRLTSSDIREYFFQAVSNSLWANRAYIAAVEIKGEDTLEELNMLCALHGIGYLSIDPANFMESRILIPARERDEVDWASANRIAEENGDFRTYLQNVLNYLKTGHVMIGLWDHTDR
ncbi:MAG: HrgA protein [Rhodospirillaceae bacterium]|nr:HrgA protein [Rhodospirillales bacterium]